MSEAERAHYQYRLCNYDHIEQRRTFDDGYSKWGLNEILERISWRWPTQFDGGVHMRSYDNKDGYMGDPK